MKRLNKVVILGLVVIVMTKVFTDLNILVRLIILIIGFGICMYGAFYYKKEG